MADAQKTIDLIFNAVDKTGAATIAALDNAKKFTSSVENITRPIADFTLGAAKFEAGVLAAGVAATVFAVKIAGDFDTSFRQVSTLFDANDKELAGFKESILEYARTSQKPLTEIVAAVGAAIGSGVKYGESLKVVREAEVLAVGTRSDLKSATETLVGTLNAYGMSTDKAGEVAEFFFKVIRDGKIEMKDLSASFANVTAIAPQAGVKLESLGAAIAVLTANSVAPATAIDAVKSAISNIIKPTEQAKKMAAELGIEFDVNALKSKDFAGVLADVAKATGGSAEKIAVLFGDVTGLGAVLSLTGASAGAFAESLLNMRTESNNLALAVKVMSGSIEASQAIVGNAFTTLMIRIGAPLLDEFGGIAKAVANIFNAIGDSAKDGKLKGLVSYVESVFADIEKAISKVAQNLPAALERADFSGFTRGIDLVLRSLTGLFGNIDLSTVDGLKLLIEGTGAAFLGLSAYVSGAINAFKPLVDALISVGLNGKAVNVDLIAMFGAMGSIATQITYLMPVLSAFLGLLSVKEGIGLAKSLAELPSVITAASLAAQGGIGFLGTAGLAGAFGAAGYQAGKVLAPAIDSVISSATGSKTSLGGFIYDLINGAEEAKKLGLGATGAAKGIGEIGDAAKGAVPLGDLTKRLTEALESGKGAGAAFAMTKEEALRMVNAAEKASTSQGKLSGALQETSKYALETVPILDALTGKVIGYEQQLVKSAKGTIDLAKNAQNTGASLKKTAADIAKAEESQKKWNEEVAKMNFAEKLKLIDQQTQVTTARLAADAKTQVAAFESLGSSIDSTAKLLGELTGQFKDFDKVGSTDQSIIRTQIELENKRRQQAFDLQSKLTEATIAQMKAQTNALIKGEGLIKIDGAGLKPHLEAFMWEILQTIQVRVNKDGLKLLLGV